MKFLIIRFSSFGDIAQCLSITASIKSRYPQAQIHFLTKKQFVSLVEIDPCIDRVIAYEASSGILGLFHLSRKMKASGYTHIYDAHQVLRSQCLVALLLPWIFLKDIKLRLRSKNRWKRFFYFNFRMRTFKFPFYGAKSFLEPLKDWDLGELIMASRVWKFSKNDQDLLSRFSLPTKYLVFAPSAAWEMKRWPISHWQELLSKSTDPVVFLGGKEDTFIEQIIGHRKENTYNLAGKVSLSGSALVISKAEVIVSADTGVLHLADLMNKKTIALIGPTAFGYPSSVHAIVLDLKLSCAPCTKDGRGRCTNEIYQRCLVDIGADSVIKVLNKV